MIASFTLNWKRKEWGTLLVLVYILYTAGFVGTCGIAFTPSAETRYGILPDLSRSNSEHT